MRTRKTSWGQSLRHGWRRLTVSPLVVWDVGSVRTKVLLGQKMVLSQATCVVIGSNTGEVIAQGDEAYRLLGNTSAETALIFPVERGSVADGRVATVWLQCIRSQLWPRRRWLAGLRSPRGLLCLNEGVGEADRAVWRSLMEVAGLENTQPASALIGIAWYLNLATTQESCFILEMGGSQTQIGIVSQGKLVSSQAIGWGGLDVTRSVQQWVQQSSHCQVSWRAAEQLKCEYGSLAGTESQRRKTTIRGKDPYTQLGTTAVIEVNLLRSRLAECYVDLLLFIRHFLASVPVQIATTCLENGLWIAGGASQLSGLDQWLSSRLATPVSRVGEPTLAASKGAAVWAAAQAGRPRTPAQSTIHHYHQP